MEKAVKRIGYLPRKRVLEIIDQISKSESISMSKVVGILVEEALGARGIANFGFSNLSKTKSFNSENYNDKQTIKNISNSEDELVDDSGYTISSHKTLDRSISTADIELANKINILKESGLI
ncbi:CopG family transcriptional regulator [Prochlorococcus sp. AH-716-E13]|nr:CopG family transcriptional regulator [Prochlorococcus sp. AH-716-E13]